MVRSMGVIPCLLAICIVDMWKVYACEKGDGSQMSPNQIYCEFVDQLIDNSYDRISLRQQESSSAFQEEDMDFGSGF